MWTDLQFWKDATWRSFRTFCQTLAAMLGGQAVNALTAPWASMLSVSGTAALVSLLMSVDRERAVGSAVTEPIAERATPGVYITEQTAPATLVGPPVYGCGDSIVR